ncbi:MAG: NADH-quinone oxidoreductase subunit H, partial [Candidatus Dadabacteria bacterium]|nr:NADH-quinone oxidoreductase subunit H [Candidatus Dadabacteria bacterium]NIQ16792.1 NADH-quinone oxidoreductase subunit H [Candidatus Dadabacteria bacterium]
LFLFIWVRWTIPRFRYDQVMNLGWKKLFPLAILNLLIISFLIIAGVI